MGMTIDDITQGLNETVIICNSVYDYSHQKYIDEAKDKLRKYQQLQADYENRLKADMVAMLTELQLEIEETVKKEQLIDKKWANGLHYSEKIIQQKINVLKAESEGKE